ncbi:hypothetical protein [Lentibacillus salicampi]|nr:hypothetical protein [Lentibacillus salicampi]
MSLLKAVQLLTGSQAYVLLFNTDYVPLLHDWGPENIGGIAFHFVFCIASVVALFYLLIIIRAERSLTAYFLIYTAGSAILYSLTGLTERPPDPGNVTSWGYWTAAHAVYAVVVGWLVKTRA